MRICHVSWEYPPVMYGGLGRHVYDLTGTQAHAGHDVTVITQAPSGEIASTQVDERGVRVVRTASPPEQRLFDAGHLIASAALMEHAMIAAGIDATRTWTPDVIHAHDWMVTHAATALSSVTGAPLVATIHATEAGRMGGWVHSEVSRAVHNAEWRLTHAAQQLIVCSGHMRGEVESLFGTSEPTAPITVIPNGIALDEWRTTPARKAAMRLQYSPDGPMILFTGRLEWEKGIHSLVEAMPLLRKRVPGIRLVVAGRGSKAGEVVTRAKELRLGRSFIRTGWLPARDLHALIAAADCQVIPSLYEPFGLVALEATALGTPVVVARTGGLAEFVDDDRCGWTFEPGDSHSLADVVASALTDAKERARRTRAARTRLRTEFAWKRIAELTDAIYAAASRTPTPDDPGLPPEIPQTNLLSTSE